MELLIPAKKEAKIKIYIYLDITDKGNNKGWNDDVIMKRGRGNKIVDEGNLIIRSISLKYAFEYHLRLAASVVVNVYLEIVMVIGYSVNWNFINNYTYIKA